MKTINNLMKYICLLFAFLFAFTSCSSIYGHMPETEASDVNVDPSEEYFTTGDIVSIAAGNVGVAYEGQWIYVESGDITIREDNPDTPYNDALTTSYERIVKYNPVTQTVSSLCLDPTCLHSSEECPFFAPHTWLVAYFEVFGDWLMYSFYYPWNTDPDVIDVRRNYLYNLKTGELRELHSNTKEGELISRTTSNYVMNGKIYSTLLQLDYSGEEEWKAMNPIGSFKPETHQYVEMYDPETNKVTRLFEIPEDYYMFCISNKRLFFQMSDYTYWSSDYNGENMKQETKLITAMLQLCDKYAYFIENPDYLEKGYNARGYDLETDSVFQINFGCQIRNLLIDSGKLAFTTFSRIDEYRECVKTVSANIKEQYPDMKPEERAALELQMLNSIQYDGTFQLYLTDALGNNKELVFEGENMNIAPLRMVGNYLYGYVSYGDPNNDFAVTYPGNDGRCALNLETGEITLIPQLEIYLDSQQ